MGCLGGYDEVLLGYATGGDTDLEARLGLIGLSHYAMDPAVIETVLEHDNNDRTRHHRDPIATSYCAGLLYRRAKFGVLQMRGRVNLPLETRRQIYEVARIAALGLGDPDETISIEVNLDHRRIRMPRQLGYERGTHKLSLKVELSVEDRLQAIPE